MTEAAHRSGRRGPPVLVIGGAGYLGTELCHRLLQSGERVRILDSLGHAEAEANLTWLARRHDTGLEVELGDVSVARDVAGAMRGVRAVYHLVEGNERGVVNVLECARERSVLPVIYTSTLSVLPGPKGPELLTRGARYEPASSALTHGGLDERSTPKALEGANAGRLVAERRALAYAWHHAVPVVVLRLGELIGLSRHGTLPGGWVNDVVCEALAGWSAGRGVEPRDVRDLLFVDDAVKALLVARRKLGLVAGGLFHVCGGPQNALSAAELLVKAGSPLQLSEIVAPEAPGAGSAPRTRTPWRVGSPVRFQAATGWRPAVAAPIAASRLYQASDAALAV